MKLLVDMNLSPRWIKVLADAGIDSAHWSSLGVNNAPDVEIMAYASVHDYAGMVQSISPSFNAWNTAFRCRAPVAPAISRDAVAGLAVAFPLPLL